MKAIMLKSHGNVVVCSRVTRIKRHVTLAMHTPGGA